MLILSIAENLHKLLKNSSMTSMTALGKLGRVVKVTVDSSLVFIVGVLSSEHSWAYRAGEMFDMVFAL